MGIQKVPDKAVYDLDELLQGNDEEFVQLIFLALLKRQIDPVGREYYLSRLDSGVSRENVIAQILKSKEAAHVRVTGVEKYQLIDRIFSIPILGNIIAALVFLLTIQSHLKALRVLEGRVNRIYFEMFKDGDNK